VSTFTIGEAAERSGFSATALRYYEDIGLVVPTSRTDAGYRIYDDAALTRLSFIARAKQLGCSLDEITDLVTVWDGERCGPVQRRFHELVTAKISAAQRQIDELNALVGQLHDAAAHLDRPPTDGPCSAACACMAVDATAPVACTASGAELAVRTEQLERMRADLDGFERTAHGLLLHFPDRTDIASEVRRFVADEQGCCAFWDFATTTQEGIITLRWDGPAEVDELLDRLADFFAGDQPMPAMDGLL